MNDQYFLNESGPDFQQLHEPHQIYYDFVIIYLKGRNAYIGDIIAQLRP